MSGSLGRFFGSMTNQVSLISCSRIPAEVFHAVVGWISVVMTTFHSFWTWPDEGFDDESVNRSSSGFVGFAENDYQVFVRAYTGTKYSTFDCQCISIFLSDGSIERSNSSFIGYLVRSFISSNIPPLFIGKRFANLKDFIKVWMHGSWLLTSQSCGAGGVSQALPSAYSTGYFDCCQRGGVV